MSIPQADVPEAVTYREVHELLRTFAASDWTGLTLRVAGMTITAGRHGPPTGSAPSASPVAAAPAPAPANAPAKEAATVTAAASLPRPVPSSDAGARPPAAVDISGCVPVRSPAVGSFWVAPQPGAPPFAEVGQAVAEGDQLAIVEVMKLMNPVLAPQAGQIAKVCAANADLVEYEQVLFWIRPQEAAGG